MSGLNRGQTGARSINKLLNQAGTPVNAVASQGTLTIAEAVTAEDTMQIGSVTYTFKANGTADAAGEIDMGADEAATKLAIVTAIKGTDGLNARNPSADCEAAFSTDDLVLTARVAGLAGDGIATIEGLTHASNIFDAVTLGTTTAGVNGTPGDGGSQMIDDTNLYICFSDGHFDNASWRKIAHSSL